MTYSFMNRAKTGGRLSHNKATNIKWHPSIISVMTLTLNVQTEATKQKVLTQIRLLLKERSDHGLY